MGHSNWTKIIPTVQYREKWGVRSILWVRKDVEVEQVPMQSADLTAALLRLPDRSILIVSAYVETNNADALLETMNMIRQAIQETRNRTGTRVDVILTGTSTDTINCGEGTISHRQDKVKLTRSLT